MRFYITTLSLFVSWSSSSSSSFTTIHPDFFPAADAGLIPTTASGNTECSSASSNTAFQLTFISYGNWTALPGQEESPIQHLESVSFAVSNAANGVSTVCAFSLGATLSGGSGALDDSAVPPWATVVTGTKKGREAADSSTEVEVGVDAAWQACADRKDTDGKHRFTIATGAAFALAERSLAVNQTWFCHDDAGRLVAFTGVASTALNLTCSESEVSGYHLQNCTSSDLTVPVTLL
ncbi:hypothetical protein F5Y10DRAFT_286150 [Nemania abortiva]|nr:hypothetical protein F5Y10DRAFT_286150 [Nemania abortiva]